MTDPQIYVQTNVLESCSLSQQSGYRVYLKLENTQPSHSFKLRGISNLCKKAKQKKCHTAVCASGGNAGLAATYACRCLGIKPIIVVPSNCPIFAQERLRQEGAHVIVHGSVWDESNEHAQDLAQQDGHFLVHPFDHPDVWTGHGTMIEELKLQLDKAPDLIIASVGGGGLMCGIIQGLVSVGWTHVPLLAMETVGADCFNKSVSAGEIITLPGITSIANCLGAKTVCRRLFECYKEGEVRVRSRVVSDKQSVQACLRFADDHKMLVEPACGAALAAVYEGVVDEVVKSGELPAPIHTVVVIVCGGAGVTLHQLQQWKQDFKL